MKKTAFTLLLIASVFTGVSAQEIVVDSVRSEGFKGLLKGGNMGEVLYLPYFTTNKTDKKNFIIRQIESNSLREDKVIRLELPQSYELDGSAFNGMGYLLAFYDAAKKESALITVSNGNIVKKKTLKAGKKYVPLNTHEGFLLVTIGNKGAYSLESIDIELKSKWEKSFSPPSGTTWDLLSIKTKMEGLEIVRKENKAAGKYSFSLHMIQPDEGTDISQSTIGNEEFAPYPTFSSEKEGMTHTGGYFFKDGIYSKQPDGVFIATMMMDGNLNDLVKVPFSQVIEAVKSTLGGKLSSGNSTIVFTGGVMLHETQNLVMTGQLITKKDNENGCTVTLGEFVTLKIGFDGTFKDATIIKTTPEQITLEGDVKSTNIIDLGTWLNNAGLLHFKQFSQMPGNPIMSYVNVDENGVSNLCFRNVGIVADTLDPLCMPLNREPRKSTPFAFNGIATPPQVTNPNSVIFVDPMAMNYTTFGLMQDHLTIRKMPVESLEKLQIHIMPEDPGMEDPGHDPEAEHEEEQPEEEQPEENNTSE